jgi:hypothetical protein
MNLDHLLCLIVFSMAAVFAIAALCATTNDNDDDIFGG